MTEQPSCTQSNRRPVLRTCRYASVRICVAAKPLLFAPTLFTRLSFSSSSSSSLHRVRHGHPVNHMTLTALCPGHACVHTPHLASSRGVRPASSPPSWSSMLRYCGRNDWSAPRCLKRSGKPVSRFATMDVPSVRVGEMSLYSFELASVVVGRSLPAGDRAPPVRANSSSGLCRVAGVRGRQ